MNYKLKLKELRKKKGKSQKELADMIGIAYQNISDYERGIQIPNLERSVQIAQALNITLDELIEYDKAHEQYTDKLLAMLEDEEE